MSLGVSGFVNDDAYPYQAVAYITAWWGSQSAQGSGFLVGPNDLLTAAHVVYDFDLGGWATRIDVQFSYDPQEGPGQVYNPVNYRAYTGFDSDRDGLLSRSESERDISILTFNTNVGNSFGWFGVQYGFSGGPATLLGYAAKDNGYISALTMNVRPDPVDWVLNYDRNTNSPGASGGPIVVSGPYAIGIHSTGQWAVDLADHDRFIRGWTRINDALTTSGTDVFRFFNKKTGHHFFTTSTDEAFSVFMNLDDYSYEGIKFGISQSSGNLQVFRMHNSLTGRHLYTASVNEMRVVDAQPGWNLEGISFNAHQTGGSGREEVFRFLNTVDGSHFYTSDDNEANQLRTNSSFRHFSYEGVAFYTDTFWG